MPSLSYTNVESRQLGVGVRTRAGWWNWKLSAWSSPFRAADHVQACERDRDLPSIQEASVPAEALVPGASVVDGVIGPGGDFTPSATLNAPSNYLDYAMPARGILCWRP